MCLPGTYHPEAGYWPETPGKIWGGCHLFILHYLRLTQHQKWQMAMEMAIEIVSFPIENGDIWIYMVIFHSYFHITRG